ncbi:MAG TPA: NAD-dependent epimerase/dehydratase family protein, partial [Acidimicrobiales bacterium]|nr:NAD-dependent epimerase/dehydratase family protein [Acidimicrobiales bacterium]
MSRVVVAGGAGFLGSHLCQALLARGDEVVAVDNLSTGRIEFLAGATAHERFELATLDLIADADALPQAFAG